DLYIYTQLYYQLTDANGVDYMLESTLLKSSGGRAAAVALSPAQVSDLKKWLFEGSDSSSSIYSFLSDRAKFQSAVLPPPAQNVVLCLLKADQLNDSQIFELSL